ncbi:MAG: hypothetical protein AB7V42_07920 [Thermoleophilia bacterium]
MSADPTTPLAIQVSDPSYGPGLDPTEADTASVDATVEGVPFAPITPQAVPEGELAFIDGAQQVEAWLTLTVGGDPAARPGAAFAVAAGAVLTGPRRQAEIARLLVRRYVLTVGRERIVMPATGGFTWESRADAANEATGIARFVGLYRQQLELSLAEQLADGGRLVVLDGPLSHLRDGAGPVMGAVKSHHRMYLPPAESRAVVGLEVGQRTPLFAIGDDRLSWYQRLPGVGSDGWAGILRGELPASVGVAAARALADRAAAELPRYAGRPHRDPRAPQNMTPIAGLENRLRHRMGDRRLALRAVRRAVAMATIDAPSPVRVDVAAPLEPVPA